MRTAVCNHLEEAAARVFVLSMLAEVAGELIDFLREERNLHLRRAGVLVVDAGFLNNARLFLLGKHV